MNRQTEKVKNNGIKAELAMVDKLLKKLENNKRLPTFGEFFVLCMVSGNPERINLKSMYPDVYSEINAFLMKQGRKSKR
jgi:hypothetical protein